MLDCMSLVTWWGIHLMVNESLDSAEQQSYTFASSSFPVGFVKCICFISTAHTYPTYSTCSCTYSMELGQCNTAQHKLLL